MFFAKALTANVKVICYVMLCKFVICYIMLRYKILCCVKFFNVKLFFAMLMKFKTFYNKLTYLHTYRIFYLKSTFAPKEMKI